MKNTKTIITTLLYTSLAIFGLLVNTIVFQEESFISTKLMMPLIILWSIFGAAIVLFTVKGNFKRPLKTFLYISGIAQLGFLGGVILHNFFYAIGEYFSTQPIIRGTAELLHGAFFIFAIILSPIGFLIGTTGSLLKLRAKTASNPTRGPSNTQEK